MSPRRTVLLVAALALGAGTAVWAASAELPPTVTLVVQQPPPQLQLDRTAIAFGAATVDDEAVDAVTVTNVGGQDLAFGPVAVADDATGAFGVDADACAQPLPRDASCELTLTFRPPTSGEHHALLAIASNDPDGPHRVQLTGIGVPAAQARLTPASVDFGDVDVGDRERQPVTLRNVGGRAATFAGAAVDPGGAFSVDDAGCAGRTLAPNSACELRVAFAPTADGRREAVLTAALDGVGEVPTAALSGVGTPVVDEPEPSVERATPAWWWLAGGALLATAVAAVLARPWRRSTRWVDAHVRVEPAAATPTVGVDAPATSVSVAIRLLPRRDPGTQTYEEVHR